jgi:hypothetical protein
LNNLPFNRAGNELISLHLAALSYQLKNWLIDTSPANKN